MNIPKDDAEKSGLLAKMAGWRELRPGDKTIGDQAIVGWEDRRGNIVWSQAYHIDWGQNDHYPTMDLYKGVNFHLAWQIHMWAMDKSLIKREYIDWWRLSNPWASSQCQRLFLDRIFDLVLEAAVELVTE